MDNSIMSLFTTEKFEIELVTHLWFD